MSDQALTTEPAPVPGEPAQTLPAEVVFGLKADVPDEAKAVTGWSLQAFAWVVGVLFALAAWTLLSRYLPLPRPQSMAVYAAVAALVWWLGRRVMGRRGTAADGVCDRVDAGAGRLRVAGKHRELAKLRAMGEVRDEPFEPMVLLAPRIIDVPWQATALMVTGGVAFCGLMLMLKKTTLPYMNVGWIPFAAGYGLGVGAQMLLWPTYARVTPGRLDIMRYRLWSRRPRTVTYLLRGAQVLAHMDKATLFIKPAAPGSRWTALNLRGVWSAAALTHAVLRGAASSAPTPPLPEDELVG